MSTTFIRAQDIPEAAIIKLARPLIRIVREDLKDPKIRALFDPPEGELLRGEVLPAN